MKNNSGNKRKFHGFIQSIRKRGRIFRMSAYTVGAIMIFLVTYMMILPAITIDKDSAAKQPGMKVSSFAESGQSAGRQEDRSSEIAQNSNGTAISDPTESDIPGLPDSKDSQDKGDQQNTDQKNNIKDNNEGKDSDQGQAGSDDGRSSDAVDRDSSQNAEDKSTKDQTGTKNQDSDSSDADKQSNDSQETPDPDSYTMISSPTTLIYEGEDYTVSAYVDEFCMLPEGVRLQVKEIRKDVKKEKKRYQGYYDKALEEINRIDGNEEGIDQESFSFARFFDISFVKDGQAIEPASPVDISINLDQSKNRKALEGADAASLKDREKIRVVHFDETGEETQAEEVFNDSIKNTKKKNIDIQFAGESFSVYGVVYTVDFHWEADGKEYDFSMPGGGYMSFYQLVKDLKIRTDDAGTEKDEIQELVDGAESIRFSDPDLVSISKVNKDTTVGAIKDRLHLECEYSADLTKEDIREINAKKVKAGDWALISLKPFDTEESLTVTMNNGDEWTVKVTDAQIKKTVIDAKGDTWEIAVTYDDHAQIPEGAELRVSEILPGTEEYSEYYRKAANLVCTYDGEGNRHGYGRLFDVSIWKESEEIEPQSNVQVSIKLANAPEDSDELSVVHFGENKPELMQVEAMTDREPVSDGNQTEIKNDTELWFETDSFSLYAVISTYTSNGYGLGGQKFAIVNRNNSITEAVSGRSQENNTALSADGVTVNQSNGQEYLAGQEVTLWEFEYVYNNVYHIKAPNGQYMHVGNGTAYLSNEPQAITVSQSGNGLRLENSGYGLNAWNRDVSQGFRAGTYNDDASRFTLYGISEVIQNQADKISLTDLVKLHDGEVPVEDVVIYTRLLNQDSDGYDYYAVAADGSLTRVYDIGDTIGWGSSETAPEHLKWKLTVHSDNGDPNGYFDFQSMENDMYLIPTETSGLKTDDPEDSWDLGVNMQGWNNGTYGSTIERWDTGSREYVGYAYDAVNKKIVPTTDDSQKLEFLFAHIKEDLAPNQLHTVETLDGKTKGITIKMYDFDGSSIYNNDTGRPRSTEMTNVMGSNSIGSTNINGVGYANRGLVSQTLTNGFPIATETGLSLNQLFDDDHFKSDASNIFVQQTYNETGYFSYDSSINYAYLDQNQNKFILYRELAAPVMEANNWTPSGQKGNFFPFDSLQELADQNKVFTNGIAVKYDGDLQEMSADNPLYGQTLYRIDHGNTNNYKSYFFGMTMEADFYQGPDGKDERGNDIIYEFNGDDDMWLYIDDRLVLDIGGCHGAVSGTINFSTGEVRVNGSSNQVQTTLKKMFQNAGKLPDGTDWTTAGAEKWFKGDTFADYTKHSFKMFYMERGSYASNLKMRFNLLTIEPGSFVLEKKLHDNVQAAYGNQLFAYQIYTVSAGQETLYTPPAGKSVTYEKSGEMVLPDGQTESAGFKPEYTVNGQSYQNVYFLKAGESIIIPMENNEVHYYVKEIGIDPIYEEVKANGRELEISNEEESRIAQTSTDVVKTRGRVTYENVPKEVYNLRLEKIIQGQIINSDDSFRFDVRLEDAKTGQLVPYNQGEYYIIKEEDGVDHYYKYENRQLVPSNEPVPYKAGISGSIDHIYPGYTILIKGLLPGTNFLVTENLSSGNYPAGYQYVSKKTSNAGQPEVNGADGSILAREGDGESSEEYQDALVQITNASGTNVTLVKVDNKDLNKENPDRLKGASFTISKYTDDSFREKDTAWGNEGSKALSDVKNPDGTYTLNGIFEFEQLVAGYYMIEETAFPAGYVKLSGNPTFKVEVDASSGFTTTLINNPDNLLHLEDDKITIIVGNTPGAALPNMGGPGTNLFYILGIMLTGLAGSGLVMKRRRRNEA